MKTKTIKIYGALLIVIIVTTISSCSGNTEVLQSKIDSLQKELEQFKNEKAMTEARLISFDSLDFDYYSGQKWKQFADSHADNIKVYYPDGTTTENLFPEHIDMLKPMFEFAPDTKIKTHPVKFGSGDWTAVIGEMEGTFSEPMSIGDGKTIPPTNKKFKLSMCTIGHWDGNKMVVEYLFWDNQSFMNQIGLGN